MVRFFTLAFFILIPRHGAAQYFQFSQYNFTSQRITPAAPANSDYAQLSFIYRNQDAGGDLKLNSNMLSAIYPITNKKTGRRWSGVGITLLDDRTGGIYSVTEGSLSYAVNVFLSESQSLSLGFKGLYQQRKIDISRLYTGSQFIDRGFDQYADNGENNGTFRSDFITVSTGLSWQQLSKDGIRTAYLSCSLFDFNKPDDSFLDGHKLNSTIVAAAGFRLVKKNNLSIFPEALYTRGSANNVVNIGMITRCNVKGAREQKPFYVDLISKYVLGRSAILGLQFQNQNFSFGFSYDWPIQKGNAGNLGAFEIGVELRSLVATNLKDKTAKKKTSPQQRKPVVVAKKILAEKIKPVSVEPDYVETKKPLKNDLTSHLKTKRDSVVANAKAGQISHNPFVLDKVTLHFNFEFNSSDLDELSTQYLDDLIIALEQDHHLRIKLTGHTDNVGSANFNTKLSAHRANAVKKHLVSKGVNSERIETDGKGMVEPLNENKTEEDRAKNRRVELTILYIE